MLFPEVTCPRGKGQCHLPHRLTFSLPVGNFDLKLQNPLHFPSVMSFYKCAEELSLCYALRCVCNEIRIPFVQHLPAVFYSWPNVATYWPSMLAGCTLLVCEFSIGINSICRFSMCIDGYGHAWHTFANAFNAFSAGMGIF